MEQLTRFFKGISREKYFANQKTAEFCKQRRQRIEGRSFVNQVLQIEWTQ